MKDVQYNISRERPMRAWALPVLTVLVAACAACAKPRLAAWNDRSCCWFRAFRSIRKPR